MVQASLLAAAFALVLPARMQSTQTLLLEIRVFNGTDEVTGQTRVLVHRAGDRGTPVAEAGGGPSSIEIQVVPGIYDVQAIRERDGQVVNIQWAHRLVVMPYPDEGGRHLEVLNFSPGFGALQVRAADGSLPEATLHPAGGRDRMAGAPVRGTGYVLFVVPAGQYELSLRRGARLSRHAGIEVPRDRTRLWLVPAEKTVRLLQTRRPDSSRIATTMSAMTSRT